MRKRTINIDDKIGDFIVLAIKRNSVRVQCKCKNLRSYSHSALIAVKEGKRTPYCNVCIAKLDPLQGFQKVWNDYVRQSKLRKKVFKLSHSEFLEIIKSPCYYCGVEPSNNINKIKKIELNYSGIDRVDNNIGYIKSNCVPCCKICNYAKHYHTQEEFYSWIKRLLNNKRFNDQSASSYTQVSGNGNLPSGR